MIREIRIGKKNDTVNNVNMSVNKKSTTGPIMSSREDNVN